MSPEAVRRLGALLPLLASRDEAEILHAVQAANRILAENKLSWRDVAERLARQEPRAEVIPFPKPVRVVATNVLRSDGGVRQPSQWKRDALDVQKAYDHLEDITNPWRQEFLQSVHEWVIIRQGKLSPKQRDILEEILDQLDV